MPGRACPEIPGPPEVLTLPSQAGLLPARGVYGSPLTAPPSRHWKSFRTSSQLSKPSLRVDPRRARRRRQRQLRCQMRVSILGVWVAPSPPWSPLSRAPCAGGAGVRCVAEAGGDAMRRRPPEDSARTAASPARARLFPLEPRG